jgi:2-polyprenyl-6-hydroxyphenyl methylase / 3-demethylubiquinone-9 3-methyltransferase
LDKAVPADNTLYDLYANEWWNENSFLHLLKTGLNPARFGYFLTVFKRLGLNPASLRVLDVGCGGGILSEEFARLGCQVSGLDQSAGSIATAQAHARLGDLAIDYRVGKAEMLPFESASFDVVVCCDMLEHVAEVGKLVAEAARVLRGSDSASGKPGGLYLFDTINRTFQSYFETIFISQVLPSTRIFAPGTHAWRQFIRPDEIKKHLKQHKLQLCELTGLQPGISSSLVGVEISRLKRGDINYAEFGRRLKFQTGGGINGNYIGYAERKGLTAP